MKHFYKVIIGLLVIPICYAHSAGESIFPKDNSADLLANSKETIDLQDKVFERYYNQLSETAKKAVSIEDFKSIYGSNSLDATTLVETLNRDNGFHKRSGEYTAADYTACRTIDDFDFIISDNHGRKKDDSYIPAPAFYSNDDKNYSSEKNN